MITFILGLFTGGIVGVTIVCCCVMAGRADEKGDDKDVEN